MSAVRAVFDRVNSQFGMIAELELQLHQKELPRLKIDSKPEDRAEWIRHVITKYDLADSKVRPSRSETWAQAFERVCGEGLE